MNGLQGEKGLLRTLYVQYGCELVQQLLIMLIARSYR